MICKYIIYRPFLIPMSKVFINTNNNIKKLVDNTNQISNFTSYTPNCSIFILKFRQVVLLQIVKTQYL